MTNVIQCTVFFGGEGLGGHVPPVLPQPSPKPMVKPQLADFCRSDETIVVATFCCNWPIRNRCHRFGRCRLSERRSPAAKWTDVTEY